MAPKEWDAIRAAKQLKITWSEVKPPFAGNASLYDHIRAAKVMKKDEETKEGDVEGTFAKAAKVVEATYTVPYLGHARMEPGNATAMVAADRVDVWTGDQSPQYALLRAANEAGIAPEKVFIHTTFLGGGYGSTGYKPGNKQGHYFWGRFNPQEHTAADGLRFLRTAIDRHVAFWNMAPDASIFPNLDPSFRAMAWPGRQYVLGTDKAAQGVVAELPAGAWTIARTIWPYRFTTAVRAAVA